jgi:hypothetical protein
MGFKVGRVFALDFSGTDVDGAIVRIRSASIGTLQEMMTTDDVEREAEIFADHLISWNLEYDGDAYPDKAGQQVPATGAGVLSLEEPVRDLLVKEWWKATRGITVPLDHRSNGGRQSPDTENTVPPMTMETL